MKKYFSAIVILLPIWFSVGSTFAGDGFTQKDRELLIELKVKMGEIDKRFEQIDKRFKQVDKGFEQVDKRFDQLNTFLYILAGIFTSLVIAVIGFAYWDRRTMVREARREAIEFMEKEGLLRRLLDALKELSREDNKLAEALRRFNLL
jgi:hypothetical protein